MSTSYTLVRCEQCVGLGLLSNSGGTLSCPSCLGSGSYLVTEEGKRLQYRFPNEVQPGDAKKRQLARVLRYVGGASSIATTVLSAVWLSTTPWQSLGDLIWQRHPATLTFGVSGLLSIWSLSHFQRHQTSSRSLHSLEAGLAALPPGGTLILNPYFNVRFTTLLEEAASLALQHGSPVIQDGHLLRALIQQPRILVMLERLEYDGTALVDAIEQGLATNDPERTGRASLSAQLRTRLTMAVNLAINLDFPYVDLEDLLLAYATTQDEWSTLLAEHGLTYTNLFTVSRWYAAEQQQRWEWAFWEERGRLRPSGYMNRAWTARPTPLLDNFGIDITQLARAGKASFGTVRQAELEETLTTLASTGVHNVLLVGEPGSGTEDILTALATRMLEERVPEPLKDKRLVQVDLTRLLTSSQSEQTLAQVLEEVAAAGNVILAIPDIKELAGSRSDALTSAGILASALKDGYLQIVSTASYEDYHRFVEQDALLKSLLHIVELHELTPEETLTVLEEESDQLEAEYNLLLTFPAIQQASTLAARYLPDHPAPGGAREILLRALEDVRKHAGHKVQAVDVIRATEALTPVPIAQATSQEADKLLNLEEELHRRVVGQDQAVKAVAAALRRARAGLANAHRPVGSFLFVGPTGVGKTELAKALAAAYFGSDEQMVRLDMSEFQEVHSIDRLIGPPASSPDSTTEGGLLTQPIREHPFSLILLDEIEKAHPDVLNLFLQILDDGRLTENTGRTVHFENCIIIATSNAGSSTISRLLNQGSTPDQLNAAILQLLESSFRPEFLNRFDAIVPFSPLNQTELRQIAELIVAKVGETAKTQGITLEVTPEALDRLVSLGYNPTYGARPLRRAIEQRLEDIVAEHLLRKDIPANTPLRITAEVIH